ncbi:nucleotide cyclase, partial [Baffinella frigidus]
IVKGRVLFLTSIFAFIPVFKPMSPRAALMVVVAYVVATPAAGIAVGADAPLVVVHTFYVAMLGLSVAWLRSKGLKLSKRRFMARKNLKQRAERNRRLLGALIPRSVQMKMEETASRGEPVKAWNLPHITNAFELLDGLILALDAIVDSYGMYKYQHVNDTYLMALLAFRMKEIVSTFYTHAGERLSVQVGLNCGPAAGAVVGESRRFYCIYGDILNTASRFCSSAGPGEVVCSQMFYQRMPGHAWSLIHMGARPSVELKVGLQTSCVQPT